MYNCINAILYNSITYQYFDTFSNGISCHTKVTNSSCSVISNGQYKSVILLLTHFRSSHYVSSTLEVTYLLVHLHTIEIILFPSHSLSLPPLSFSRSPHSLVMFVLLLILFVICIRYSFNIFSFVYSFSSRFVLQ